MAVRIDGADALIKKLDNIAEGKNMQQAMGKACAIVERAAKQKAPKDTGALRRSIESKVEGEGNEVKGIVFTPLEYAPYVEYGTGLFAEKGGRKNVPWGYYDDDGKFYITSGQHPKPYMRPALSENRQKILSTLAKEGMNFD